MGKIDNIGKPLCTGISKVATLCLWILTHMIFLKKHFQIRSIAKMPNLLIKLKEAFESGKI